MQHSLYLEVNWSPAAQDASGRSIYVSWKSGIWIIITENKWHTLKCFQMQHPHEIYCSLTPSAGHLLAVCVLGLKTGCEALWRW